MEKKSGAPEVETHIDRRQPVESSTTFRISSMIEDVVGGRWTLARSLLLISSAVLAWWFRFVQDDAFISYRYARNLARGEGLVFNSGERVEGYTNFLWTLMHYVPEKLGWSSPIFSQIIGICLMMATVVVTMHLANRLFGSRSFALLVGVALVANITFLVYSTGGLETMLQAFLLISFATLVLPQSGESSVSAANMLLAGVCAGLAVLTRMDSTVLLATWMLALLVMQWRRSDSSVNRVNLVIGTATLVGLPSLMIVVPWLVWKLDYYGNLFPNTFYAKSTASPIIPIAYGLLYLTVYFFSYGSFLLIGRFRKYRSEFFATPGVGALMSVIPVWFLYICAVGGDFMEFRFMVTVTPLLAILLAFLLDRFVNFRAQALLVVVLLLFSGVHRVMPTIIPYPVLTFRELNHWPSESSTSWKGKADLLAEAFPGGPNLDGQPRIAVAPLGVLSYFSDLETTDMLGLTDAGIAREGFVIEPYYPGHVRMASVDQLLDRNVTLVLGQPGAIIPVEDRRYYRLSELTFLYPSADLWQLPSSTQVIEIPQVDGNVWLIIYIQENERVNSAIKQHDWATYPVRFECQPSDIDVVDPDEPLAAIANGVARLVAQRTCPGEA